jgi:hypothetical protein
MITEKIRDFNIYFLGKLVFGLLGLKENKKRAHRTRERERERERILLLLLFSFFGSEKLLQGKKQKKKK